MAQDFNLDPTEGSPPAVPSPWHWLTPLIRYHVVAGAMFLSLYAFDVTTRGFGYVLPIFLALFHKPRIAHVYSGIGAAMSVFGFLTHPVWPIPHLAMRCVALVSLFVVAGLIAARLQREEALRRAMRVERELLERQRNFVSILSHEVRSPLTVVDGQARRLIKLGTSGALPPQDLVRRAGKIREGARQVVDLVERILDFAAVEDGNIKPAFAAIYPELMLEDLIHRFAEHHPDRPVRLDHAQLPPLIRGDARMLDSVFYNLLSNADKFSPAGSPIVIKTTTVAQGVRISVRDYGIGIPAGAMPNLFKPYFRARNAEGIRGTGIGLHLSQRFVAMHGGRIEAVNEVDQGATFTVFLPLNPEGTRS